MYTAESSALSKLVSDGDIKRIDVRTPVSNAQIFGDLDHELHDLVLYRAGKASRPHFMCRVARCLKTLDVTWEEGVLHISGRNLDTVMHRSLALEAAPPIFRYSNTFEVGEEVSLLLTEQVSKSLSKLNFTLLSYPSLYYYAETFTIIKEDSRLVNDYIGKATMYEIENNSTGKRTITLAAYLFKEMALVPYMC